MFHKDNSSTTTNPKQQKKNDVEDDNSNSGNNNSNKNKSKRNNKKETSTINKQMNAVNKEDKNKSTNVTNQNNNNIKNRNKSNQQRSSNKAANQSNDSKTNKNNSNQQQVAKKGADTQNKNSKKKGSNHQQHSAAKGVVNQKSNNRNSSSKKKNQQQRAAKDVPMRKSDRRELCRRVEEVLFGNDASGGDAGSTIARRTSWNEDKDKQHKEDKEDAQIEKRRQGNEGEQQEREQEQSQQLETASSTVGTMMTSIRELLDIIFVRDGILSMRKVRIVPNQRKPYTLFMRSASCSSSTSSKAAVFTATNNETNNNNNSDKDRDQENKNDNATTNNIPLRWPYQHCSPQCVWIRMEEEYNEDTMKDEVVNIPTVAPLSSMMMMIPTASIATTSAESTTTTMTHMLMKMMRLPRVIVPSIVSKYICGRGANLMRAGIRDIIVKIGDADYCVDGDSVGCFEGGDRIATTDATAVATADATDPCEQLPQQLLQLQHRVVLVSLSLMHNAQPFAVGLLHRDLVVHMMTSSKSSSLSPPACPYGPGTEGIGVTITTTYGDDLWKQQNPSPLSRQLLQKQQRQTLIQPIMNPYGGGLYDDGQYGNIGFIDGGSVVPIYNHIARSSEQEYDDVYVDDDQETGYDDNDGGGEWGELSSGDEEEDKDQNDNNSGGEKEELHGGNEEEEDKDEAPEAKVQDQQQTGSINDNEDGHSANEEAMDMENVDHDAILHYWKYTRMRRVFVEC